MQEPRTDAPLKSNVLQFPALRAMPPDVRPPSVLKGLVGFIVLTVAASLLALTLWALIAL